MTQRTQVSLDKELDRRAKAKAAKLGVSFAEYVRRVVAADLGPHQPRGDITRIFGLGSGNGSDVARFKHDYVGEAVAAAYERETRRR